MMYFIRYPAETQDLQLNRYCKIAASFRCRLILNLMHAAITILTVRQSPSSSKNYPSPEEPEGSLWSSSGRSERGPEHRVVF